MSKPVKDAAITKLIQLIKAAFVKKTDITTTTVIDVDTTPTASSNNLITSGGVASSLANIISVPTYTSDDEGKVLKIVNGVLTWTTA